MNNTHHTFKEHYAHAYHKYPTLYQHELKFLNQLFFVIGNGYYWHNGILVSQDTKDIVKHDPPPTPQEAAKQRILKRHQEDLEMKEEAADEIDWRIRAAFVELHGGEENYRKWREEQLTVELNKVDAMDERQLIGSLYPISRYSAIHDLPDNIPEDWLAAACTLIQTAGQRKHCLGELVKATDKITQQFQEQYPHLFPILEPKTYREGKILLELGEEGAPEEHHHESF